MKKAALIALVASALVPGACAQRRGSRRSNEAIETLFKRVAERDSHDGDDFDTTLQRKGHGHNPHGHDPHGHNPHGHSPHNHAPHSHNPHYHTPLPTKFPTPLPTKFPTPYPTSNPLTIAPTTANPTCHPTSGHPTSMHPTTFSPTSLHPTSGHPTSQHPTSLSPTSNPTYLVPDVQIFVPSPIVPAATSFIDAVLTHKMGRIAPQSSTYVWTLYEVGMGGALAAVQGVSNTSSTTLQFSPGFLKPEQQYYVSIRVDCTPAYNIVFDQGVYFNTSASPVVAVIGGGNYRQEQTSLNITLDGSFSRDPDMAVGATASYTWTCTRRATGSSDPFGFCYLPSSFSTLPSGAQLMIPANTLDGGFDYGFTLTYTVTLASGFARSDSVGVTVATTAQPVPYVSLGVSWLGKSASQTRVPIGTPFQLMATATSRVDARNPIGYLWTERSLNLPIPNPATASVLIANAAAGRTYEFQCVATDLGTGLTSFARVQVDVSAYPVVSSIAASPTSGREYADPVTVQVSASTLEPPLSYQFAWNEPATGLRSYLTGFQADSQVQANLPRGNFTFTVWVKDSLGVTVSNTTAAPVEITSFLPASANVTDCQRYNATMYALLNTVPTIPGPNGVCGALKRGLQNLIEGFFYDRARNAINLFNREISTVKSGLTDQCSSQLTLGCNVTGGAVEAITDLEDTITTSFVDLSGQSGGAQGGNRATGQVLETLITTTGNGVPDLTSLEGLINSSRTLFEGSTDLISSGSGQTAANVLSNLVGAAIGLSNESTTGDELSGVARAHSPACQKLRDVIEQIDMLLAKTGETLVLGSAPATYATNYFKSESRAVQSSTQLNLDNGLGVKVPALASSSEVHILSAVHWETTLREGIEVCRGVAGLAGRVMKSDIIDVKLTRRGNQSSVVFYPENISMWFPARDADGSARRGNTQTKTCESDVRCQWWNYDSMSWNTTGCRYVPASGTGGSAHCSCNHLTEFVQTAANVDCSENAITALDVTFGLVGLVFAGYILLSLTRVYKLRQRKDSTAQRREFMLLLLLACVRLGSCAVFFLEITSYAAHQLVMCFGAMVSFLNFAHLLFMLGAGYLLASLSRKSIKPLQRVLAGMTVFVSLLILCIMGSEFTSTKTVDQAGAAVCAVAAALAASYAWYYVATLKQGKAASQGQHHLARKQYRAAARTRNVTVICFVLFLAQNAAWAYSGLSGIAACLVIEAFAMTVHLVGHWLGMGAKNKATMRMEKHSRSNYELPGGDLRNSRSAFLDGKEMRSTAMTHSGADSSSSTGAGPADVMVSPLKAGNAQTIGHIGGHQRGTTFNTIIEGASAQGFRDESSEEVSSEDSSSASSSSSESSADEKEREGEEALNTTTGGDGEFIGSDLNVSGISQSAFQTPTKPEHGQATDQKQGARSDDSSENSSSENSSESSSSPSESDEENIIV